MILHIFPSHNDTIFPSHNDTIFPSYNDTILPSHNTIFPSHNHITYFPLTMMLYFPLTMILYFPLTMILYSLLTMIFAVIIHNRSERSISPYLHISLVYLHCYTIMFREHHRERITRAFCKYLTSDWTNLENDHSSTQLHNNVSLSLRTKQCLDTFKKELKIAFVGE